MKAGSGSWLQEITADEAVLNFTSQAEMQTLASYAFSPVEFSNHLLSFEDMRWFRFECEAK